MDVTHPPVGELKTGMVLGETGEVPDAAATGLQAAHLTNRWGPGNDCQITAVRLSFCNQTGRAAVASDRLTMVPTQSRHDDVPPSSRRTGS